LKKETPTSILQHTVQLFIQEFNPTQPMTRNIPHLIIATIGLGLISTAALPAAVIYSDNFDFTGSLDGRTPTITTDGNQWTASTASSTPSTGSYDGDGSVVDRTGTDGTRAYLPFSPDTGTVYTLKAEISHTGNNSWMTLGFGPSSPGNDAFFNNGGISSLLLRANGDADWFEGPGTGGAGISGDGTPISGFTVDTFYEFELVLDTTGSQWTVDAFAAGSQLDLNGAAAGLTHTWSSNPTIGSVMLTSNGEAKGSYDNFELTVIPEPSAGLLALLGLLPLLAIRRRRS
jgi:hypothetical protein